MISVAVSLCLLPPATTRRRAAPHTVSPPAPPAHNSRRCVPSCGVSPSQPAADTLTCFAADGGAAAAVTAAGVPPPGGVWSPGPGPQGAMLEAQQGNSNAGGGVLSLLSSMEQRGGLVLNPPLAALTTMADMKTLYAQGPAKSLSPQSPQQVSPQLSPQEMVAASYCGATVTTSSISTPHNIENILSRPGPMTPTSPGLCGVGQMGGVGLGRLGAGVGLYGGLAGKMADLARPSSLYWPGVQGMLQNPLFWRERLQATHGRYLGVSRAFVALILVTFFSLIII